MSILSSVKKWLLETWKVPVPDDWLSACCEWVQEQQGDGIETFESQCSLVFDQWLMSDLRDIGSSSFPPNLGQYKKYLLQGIFVAQINSLMDISLPFYKQIQKLKGVENENVFVDASTQISQVSHQEDSRDKNARMMMMMMSDGCQDLMAAELHRIPSLNHDISPGTKVIIHGGVLCRMGVLLLRAENLSILGGEVDGLAEQFTPLKVIENKLGSNRVDHPPSGGQGGRPSTHELPKKVFANYTTLSNSDLSIPCRSRPKNLSTGFEERPPNLKNRYLDDVGSAGSCVATQRSSQEGQRSGGVGFVHPGTGAMNSLSLKQQQEEELFSDDDDLIFGGACEPMEVDGRGESFFDGSTLDDEMMVAGSSHGGSNDPPRPNVDPDQECLQSHAAPSQLSTHPPTHSLRDLGGQRPHVQPKLATFLSTNRSKRLKSSPLEVNVASTPPCQRSFVYISDILRGNECGTYFVKGYISTVVGKLEHNNQSWSMEVRVDDGTSTLVAQLHHQLLTKLIGFSAPECKDMRRRIKAEPALKEFITEGIKKCQEALIRMCGIFELHVASSASSSSSSSSSASSSSPLLPISLPQNSNYSYLVVDYRKVTKQDMIALRSSFLR